MAKEPAGFTLVEMLVTVVLVGLGLAAVFGGIGALSTAEARAREADLLQRLAASRWEEIGAVEDPATAADRGDFADEGYPDITWTRTVENSGIDNVDQVTVTAIRGEREQALVGLVYVPASAAAAAGGATP